MTLPPAEPSSTAPGPTTLLAARRTGGSTETGSSGGSLRLSPKPAVQGQPATVTIVPRPPFDSGSATFDFGDGTISTQFSPGYGARCASTAFGREHVWKQPGTYHVVVTLWGCLSYGYVDNDKKATVALDVRVAPGNPSGNGPAVPSGAMPVAATADAMTIHAFVAASDSDGWVTTISLDWGDGTQPAVVHESLAGCDDHGGTRYPSSSIDEDMGTHRYATAGRYTLRSTVTSTACDGLSAQYGGGPLPIEVPCAGDYENGVYKPYSCGLHPS